MSRMKLVLDIVEDLKNLADSLETLARAMEVAKSTDCEVDSDFEEENDFQAEDIFLDQDALQEEKGLQQENGLKQKISLEQVRAVLADRSRSGKSNEVRELIRSYGGNKLTDIDPNCYGDIVIEAEAL